MQLVHSKKYKGDIILGDSLKSTPNFMVVVKLISAGFTKVTVTGTGTKRTAVGVWSKATQDADIPQEVSNLQEA